MDVNSLTNIFKGVMMDAVKKDDPIREIVEDSLEKDKDPDSIFAAVRAGKAVGESLVEIVKEGPIGKIVDKVKDKFSEEG